MNLQLQRGGQSVGTTAVQSMWGLSSMNFLSLGLQCIRRKDYTVSNKHVLILLSGEWQSPTDKSQYVKL